ncbi:hypothetical protein [Chroococcidiopsis sp.]
MTHHRYGFSLFGGDGEAAEIFGARSLGTPCEPQPTDKVSVTELSDEPV